MQPDGEANTVMGLGYWAWAGLYCAAMIAAAIIYGSGLVPRPQGWWIMLVPLVLVLPMARAQTGWMREKGVSSAALTRYGRDLTLAVLAFIITFFGAISLSRKLEPGKAETVGIALLATLPLLAMIWIMIRYLRYEQDEYLRSRAIISALAGLALVLVIGAIRGYLELFGLAGPMSAMWVFPSWAIGFGLGNLWHWMRPR